MAKQQANMTKRAALDMIARADAAEAAAKKAGRRGLTDPELKRLGYVQYEGGTWGLPIPPAILKAIADDQLKADMKGLTVKQAKLVKKLTSDAASRIVELNEMEGLPFSIRCQIMAAAAKGIEDRKSKKKIG